MGHFNVIFRFFDPEKQSFMRQWLKITREELSRYCRICGEISSNPQNIYNMTEEEQIRDGMDFHFYVRNSLIGRPWEVKILIR